MNKRQKQQQLFEQFRKFVRHMIKEEAGGFNDDPTKKEMVSFLKSKFKGLMSPDPEDNEFDIEEAIYWFAYEHHGGQHSNLYSVLSTSKYKPARFMSSIDDIDDGSLSVDMYDALVEKYGGSNA